MFHTIFYLPLYNALMFLTHLFGGSLGWSVVALTLLVKLILSPLSYQATVSQIQQKKLMPLVDEIRKKYPNSVEQSQKLNELYKEHKTHPLSGCLVLLLQLPVLFAIYYVFRAGTTVTAADLYPFVTAPASINQMFLGMDLALSNHILLVITGILQFLQVQLSPAMQTAANTKSDDPQAAMAANMQKMTKFVIPVLIVLGGWQLSAAVALYWSLSSLFAIIQERVIMAILAKKEQNA